MEAEAPKTTKKSAIYGDGYGAAHVWENLGSNQVGSDDALKATYYACSACGVRFTHRYVIVEKITDAMKAEGVPGQCAPKKDLPARDELVGQLTSAKGWAEYFAQGARSKKPMPSPVYNLLARYAAHPETSLVGTTFRYIAAYLDGGAQSPRLVVACADFGYTLEELRGKSVKEVVAEILARGPDPSDD